MVIDYKPVVFMNGDDSTRRGALMVKDILYSDFTFIDADTGVDARISTNDECISRAADLLAEHGAGIKISTASNDSRIVEKSWKSANIILRPLAGVVGMYRMTHGHGAYKKPIAVMRFGSGDFYAEKSCEPTVIDGLDTRIITQHLNIADLHPFAQAAAARAKQFAMQMVISSKWTISEGETYLPNICEEEFAKAGLTKGEWRGEGDYYREIADMCAAYIPVNVTPHADCPMSFDKGGWMVVCGNANGDTFADIADLQHGDNKMGSECICRNGSSYYELPGGTAPGRKNSDFKGRKFFSPMATLIAFAGGVTTANPQAKPYTDAIFDKAEEYMTNTAEPDRCTQTMLEWIAKETKANL